MLDPSIIELESVVSFDLYPAQYLGTSIKNAKVLSVMRADVAMQLGFDAPALHVMVYSTLPPETPNGYDKYSYVYLKLASGEKTFIGLPWIKEATYVKETVRTIAIYLENVSPEKQNLATAALSGVGLSVAKVEVIDTGST